MRAPQYLCRFPETAEFLKIHGRSCGKGFSAYKLGKARCLQICLLGISCGHKIVRAAFKTGLCRVGVIFLEFRVGYGKTVSRSYIYNFDSAAFNLFKIYISLINADVYSRKNSSVSAELTETSSTDAEIATRSIKRKDSIRFARFIKKSQPFWCLKPQCIIF